MNFNKVHLKGITRPATAASAAGSKKLHEKRLEALFNELFKYASINA